MDHFVCHTEDLASGEMTAVQVGKIEIGLARHGDTFYAFRNQCPHQGAPLHSGRLWEPVAPSSEVGSYQLDATKICVRCPWHGWEFDAADGSALHAPSRMRIRTYPVHVSDSKVYVSV